MQQRGADHFRVAAHRVGQFGDLQGMLQFRNRFRAVLHGAGAVERLKKAIDADVTHDFSPPV
jgi:hypothetical protein